VIYGSAAGLTSVGDQFWSQNSPRFAGTAKADDSFGWSLAAANFGNIAHDDLLGRAGGGRRGVKDAGAVQVLYVQPTDLALRQRGVDPGQQRDHLSRGGRGRFGFSAAAADFGKSGYADVLSIPGRRTSPHGCWRRCCRNRRLVRSPGCRSKAAGWGWLGNLRLPGFCTARVCGRR
jgi:hypothetical protein